MKLVVVSMRIWRPGNSTDVSHFGNAIVLLPNFFSADVSESGRVERFLVPMYRFLAGAAFGAWLSIARDRITV
ncbi:MAG TPA: hypothetical protein DDX19_15320 [Rhodopirellula baltica]|uniref:Uncharacterized protein n=2 Tax=Rhodopirellula baltica TaxID=265606 RepID=Q7UVB3_RHOBA|nr:hypothetical protein [Rhodopirellula baltica]CAD72812.1 hypothetical protein RB2744 [Rhodopirellula baltica SH 1]HBE64076.1 hypothetical protein [Rhodopirellula baltica]